MRLAVVGAGPVGVATAVVYKLARHGVVVVEKDPSRRERLGAGVLPFLDSGLASAWADLHADTPVVTSLAEAGTVDLVVCCVGTPSRPDGAADLSQVESVVRAIESGPRTTLVMRSTVPPGTGAGLGPRLARGGNGYVSHPEFLQEGRALDDSLRPSRLVAGAADPELCDAVFALYPEADCPKIAVDVATAELIKLAANAHLAMRISFVNEMALLAERVGADIAGVVRGIGLDPRIGSHFLRAGLGYGGSCFPKDTRALSALGDSVGRELSLLRGVIQVNNRMPTEYVGVLERRLGGLAGRTIGVWGIAFKPGTDDVRESQAVRIVSWLHQGGATVRVHDPAAMLPADLPVTQVSQPLEVAEQAHAVVLATEWPEYAQLRPVQVATRMLAPRLVVDARNALPWDEWEAAGLECLAIGRRTRELDRLRS